MSLVEENATTASTKKSKNPYARRNANSTSIVAPSPAQKDDTEKALEKLLFGDDDGFYEALKQHRGPLNLEGAIVRTEEDSDVDDVAGSGGGQQEEGGHGDMEQVADDDVSTCFRPYTFLFCYLDC